MKRNQQLCIAAGCVWLVSLLIPLFYTCLSATPGRGVTIVLIFVSLVFGVAFGTIAFLLMQQEKQQESHQQGTISRSGMRLLYEMQDPIAITDAGGGILWCNEVFSERFAPGYAGKGKTLQELIRLDVEGIDLQQELLMEHTGRSYRVCVRVTLSPQHEKLYLLEFREVTEILRLRQENESEKPCVMLIVIDGYDDLLQYARESEKSQVSAAVERVLDGFMEGTNGILRKVENDLFYVILTSDQMHRMMQERFHVLDEVRQIRIGDRMHITFSIGVGDGANSLAESEKFARQALDMALGRGGDQAAVKTGDGFCFFGGTSKGVEKKSKTRIRSIALAMQELIENADNIFLMGHHFGDLDSVGAMCGLSGAIRLMEKPSYVVVNQQNCLATQLISRVKEQENPPDFLSPEDAIHLISPQSLLIIVDTHNKDILESADLYRAANTVVVIDHHRKNVNFIENAVIFHHEPYASSASEMVTEIIQYFRIEREIPAILADALLAGIMLDTKNFVMHTGVRTFEAAAYLRKIGADTMQVKTLFANSISMYSTRAEIVSHAEIYRGNAISVVKIPGDDGRILASQAADELLNIQDVVASFVLYATEHGAAISARSMGGVNVQVIMEQLGGGGHQTMAATQLPGDSIQEAKEQLLRVLSANSNAERNNLK